MSKISRDSVFSPLGTFFIYIVVSALAIMAFRLIFPGEPVPLAHFTVSWRFIRFLLDFLSLFPALALSALVIPFGFKIRAREKTTPFSLHFINSLKSSIITAIVAAVIYGALFFLVIPVVQNYETNLRYQGRLYKLAMERAGEHAAVGEWEETAQFVAVCEHIWPMGPEIAKLRIESEIHFEMERFSQEPYHDTRPESGGVPQPVDATEALTLSEKALAEERYFDAHWLATLAGRLARPGSVEETSATRLAGRAWSGVNSLAPNARESKAFSIYRLKRDGYEALVAEEWIRSYYIFKELKDLSPEDPDVIKYLALSESSLKRAAFFIDEIEMALGTILTGAVFSLPYNSGRLVMRISSLSTSPDSAYGIGVEILTFDRDGRPLWSIEAPYAKILPLTLSLSERTTDNVSNTTLLMRSLDRTDRTKYWEPVAHGLGQTAPSGVQLSLPVSWDDFLLLAKVRRGLSALSTADLQQAARNLGNAGYQSQVFEAELLRRFIEPLFLLPLGIFAIVIGWRYRALKRARYMAIPMLGILPVVFNGVEYFCRGWLNNLGIWAVVSLGFTTAALVFGIGILVLFVLSLILLAAQHG